MHPIVEGFTELCDDTTERWREVDYPKPVAGRSLTEHFAQRWSAYIGFRLDGVVATRSSSVRRTWLGLSAEARPGAVEDEKPQRDRRNHHVHVCDSHPTEASPSGRSSRRRSDRGRAAGLLRRGGSHRNPRCRRCGGPRCVHQRFADVRRPERGGGLDHRCSSPVMTAPVRGMARRPTPSRDGSRMACSRPASCKARPRGGETCRGSG